MQLICTECGKQSNDQAEGWPAYHAVEDLMDEEDVLPLCPQCAEREFGPKERRLETALGRPRSQASVRAYIT